MPRARCAPRAGCRRGSSVRGLLAVAFLGCDAFLPLALTELRGFSVAQAGLGDQRRVAELEPRLVPAGAAGPARRRRRAPAAGCSPGSRCCWPGSRRPRPGGSSDALPVAVAIAGWTVAGLGIGIGYRRSARSCCRQAPGGEEGSVSAALQLIETIGVAVFTGLGGAVIALGISKGWDAVTALAARVRGRRGAAAVAAGWRGGG